MKEKQRGRTAQDRKELIAPETKSEHEASRLKPQGQREAGRLRAATLKYTSAPITPEH